MRTGPNYLSNIDKWVDNDFEMFSGIVFHSDSAAILNSCLGKRGNKMEYYKQELVIYVCIRFVEASSRLI